MTFIAFLVALIGGIVYGASGQRWALGIAVAALATGHLLGVPGLVD